MAPAAIVPTTWGVPPAWLSPSSEPPAEDVLHPYLVAVLETFFLAVSSFNWILKVKGFVAETSIIQGTASDVERCGDIPVAYAVEVKTGVSLLVIGLAK